MVGTALVPTVVMVITGITISNFFWRKIFWKSIRSGSSISISQNSNISCVDNSKRRLCYTGISQQASSIISSSRRIGLFAKLPVVLEEVSGWFTKREIDPFQSPINNVINLSADYFSEGFDYHKIGCFRATSPCLFFNDLNFQ